MADNDLFSALVKHATGFRDGVPVFRIIQPVAEESVTQARSLGLYLWPQFGDCSFRPNIGPLISEMRLAENGRVTIYHPSVAIAGLMRTKTARKPIADDERNADRKPITALAHRFASDLSKSCVGPNDELRFESSWEMKGQGVTLKGEKGPVALFEVLGAFRRYLHGLPVWGRASVHVGIGAGTLVTRWGVDWRRIRPEPFAQTPVITPEEAAQRVLDDLSWRRPERPFTLKDFAPRSFTLGYLSQSRRRQQFVMQPVWLAVLAPNAPMTMGHVVAVPAAPQAFEPIDRPLPPASR